MPVDQAISNHWKMLGHRDLGVTELRTFDPGPMRTFEPQTHPNGHDDDSGSEKNDNRQVDQRR